MLKLHLESSIVINKSMAEIPDFFNNPTSLAAWDKSVAEVVSTSEGSLRVGYTFDTIGPSKNGRPGTRSSYRVIHLEPEYNEVELTNSKLFKKAVWGFRFQAVPEGTLTTCTMDLVVKPQYFWMGWLLRLNKKALMTDLKRLKNAIEHYEVTNTPETVIEPAVKS